MCSRDSFIGVECGERKPASPAGIQSNLVGGGSASPSGKLPCLPRVKCNQQNAAPAAPQRSGCGALPPEEIDNIAVNLQGNIYLLCLVGANSPCVMLRLSFVCSVGVNFLYNGITCVCSYVCQCGVPDYALADFRLWHGLSILVMGWSESASLLFLQCSGLVGTWLCCFGHRPVQPSFPH